MHFRRYPLTSHLTRAIFNRHVATPCALVEHMFGMLKCCFSSLRNLHLKLRHPGDERRIGCWIRACVVLHNLLINSADFFNDNKPEITPHMPYKVPFKGEERSRRHDLKRIQMMQMITRTSWVAGVRGRAARWLGLVGNRSVIMSSKFHGD